MIRQALFFLAGAAITEFVRWLFRKPTPKPHKHRFAVRHDKYIGDGNYVYTLKEYDFCLDCLKTRAYILATE